MNYNQPTPDPIAHFKAVPWCASLLSNPKVVAVSVPDRNPLPSTEANIVRVTLNTPSTVKACVVFLQHPTREQRAEHVGETRERPFLEIGCLLDVGDGVAGRAHTMHGGVYAVVLDEVLSTVAYQQGGTSSIHPPLPILPFLRSIPSRDRQRPKQC